MTEPATWLPTDRELLFYVADMFPAEAVYPGRPYGDMTLKLLVFDYHLREQPCLGVMQVNIVLLPYEGDAGQLERSDEVGTEADFILRWDTLDPIDTWGGDISPWVLYDRSFLAYLETVNIATGRQVPVVETMRLPPKPVGRKKLQNAARKFGALRSEDADLWEKLRCLQASEVSVYWGDFQDQRKMKTWQLVGALLRTPTLLISTSNGQMAVCSTTHRVILDLPEVFVDTSDPDIGFTGRNKWLLTLLAISLNSRHVLPARLMTLFVESDSVIAEPATGADALRKRLEQARRQLRPKPEEFVVPADRSPRGIRMGTPNRNCIFLTIADPRICAAAQKEGTFAEWLQVRKPLPVG